MREGSESALLCAARPASTVLLQRWGCCNAAHISGHARTGHRRPGGAAGGGGGEGGDEPLSFADALYIAGGRSAQEDLESLSNDSARCVRGGWVGWEGGSAGCQPHVGGVPLLLPAGCVRASQASHLACLFHLRPLILMLPCTAPRLPCLPPRMANRLRSLLPGEGRTALEGALAVLAPVLDLKTPHLADAAPAGTLPSGVSPATLAAVAAGHGVVAELAAAGCERADALAAAVADTAAQLVAAPAGEAAEGGTAGGDAPAGSGTPAGRQPGGATPAVQAAVPPAAAKAMAGLHADGVRTVAELCSLCLERLLGLGRSLSAFYRYAKPASDGIAWPAGVEGAGLLLRGQALRMLEELQGLGAAYGAALASAGAQRWWAVRQEQEQQPAACDACRQAGTGQQTGAPDARRAPEFSVFTAKPVLR